MRYKEKILIPGGTGFIGFHLCKYFIDKNFIVHSVSKKKPSKNRYVKGVKYILCDISKKTLKYKIHHDYKYVVNVSGYVDHSNNSSIKKTHYEGCKNLVSIFEDKNISKFVQIGSCIEYGRIKSPQKEIDTKYYKNTNSNYGNAKLLSSLYLQSKFFKKGFPATILRLYLVYGPNQENNRVIPYVIENSISGKTFNCSPGIQLRDFLFVDDLMEAIYKCIRTPISNGQIINIGTGKPIRIKDLILKITKLSGGGNPVFSKFKLRKDEIIKLYPNVKKSKKILNWVPKFSLNEGLKKTIKYYKKCQK